MFSRTLAWICCTALCLLAAGCGGRGSNLAGVSPDQPAAGAPATTPEISRGLPALAGLAQPGRELSLVGPGFFEIPLDEPVAQQDMTAIPGNITLDGGTSVAYVVYGVFGFDGDNGPTSARITASAVSTEYYVAFSDYVNNTWVTSGPFTGNAEVEIPNVDAYSSPEAYTSAQGTCYMTLLTGPGHSATFTKVELGVHGGVLGPMAPLNLSADGENPFVLYWTSIIDSRDPDFAGYRLERAPLSDGDYAALTPEPIKENYFEDTTAVVGEVYRYRLCSEDTSGNRSVYRHLNAGPHLGSLADPVVVLDLPQGPLMGPANVTFDFTDAFDPEGEAITSYRLSFTWGIPDIDSPAPVISQMLQPGCYLIQAEVEVAGPPVRSSTNFYYLKVYPAWQSTPVVIREPQAPLVAPINRLRDCSATINTAAQRLTMFAADFEHVGISVWSAPADNPAALTLRRLPLYYPQISSGDAFDVGASTYYPYSTAEGLLLARFDGTTLEQLYDSSDSVSGKITAAYDGMLVWLITDNFDGLNTNLKFIDSSGSEPDFIAVPATGTLSAIDALYNPATDTVDVVYGDTDSTEWVRIDTSTQSIVDSANLGATPADDIDLELDPATGRPIVLYSFTARHRFRQLDALNTWEAEVLVDNAVNNYIPLDLIVDDGARYTYFRTGPADQAVLYKETAGIWAPANTVSFAAASGYNVALVPQNGADDNALVFDLDSNFNSYLAQLHNDGTDSVLWQLAPSDAQGIDLQVAGGADGLHAVWRSGGTNFARHALSIDGGVTWSDPGDIGLGYSNLGITANEIGDIYFSCYNAGNAELYWWDGAVFNLRSAFPANSQHRPFLSTLPLSDTTWCAYETGTSTMHYVDAAEPAYVDNPEVMLENPIWEGVISSGIEDYWFCLVSGAAPSDGYISWSLLGADDVVPLYEPAIPPLAELYDSPATWGRTLATTLAYGTFPGIAEQSVFITRGRLFNPVKYVAPLYTPPDMQDMIVGHDVSLFTLDSLFNEELRHTVSCGFGFSATGIVLLNSVDCSRTYFAWSNYTDWEELPLPAAAEHMFSPQLLVGRDGRWHLIYKNWETDQMLSLSTL